MSALETPTAAPSTPATSQGLQNPEVVGQARAFEQVAQKPFFKEPPKDFNVAFADFTVEKETTLMKINSVRAELGLPETSEVPERLVKKEMVLLQQRAESERMPKDKPGEYINFEMIPDENNKSEKNKEQQDDQSKEKIRTLLDEFGELSMKDFRQLRATGTLADGTPFMSRVLGVIVPAMAMKLVAIYEKHAEHMEAGETIEALIETEPELKDFAMKQIEGPTQTPQENQTELPEAAAPRQIEMPAPANQAA